MPVTFTIELEESAGTVEQLDEVRRIVGGPERTMPPGMLAHLESKTATGFRIVDVWETPEDFQRFADSKLLAAFDAAGVHPLEGPPALEEVINLWQPGMRIDRERMLHEVMDAFNRNDPRAIDTYLHRDFVEHQVMPGMTPDREGVKTMIAMMHKSFEGFGFDVISVVSSHDTIAARSRMHGRHVGDFMGIPPTGKRFDVDALDYVTIDADGLAREHWGFIDTAAMMTQLGIPEQAAAIELPNEVPI